MVVKDLESKIIYLEDLLQKISTGILANVLFERAPPAELWAKSEADINAIRKVSEEIRDAMLLLKPERGPSIKKVFRDFIQPINSFVETLKKPLDPSKSSSKQALDFLRGAVTESQEFINMAKDIAKNPSWGISEILKLKEVYEAKNYISKVSVPEAIYARLEYFKKVMEILKFRISGLEQASQELLKQMDRLQEEISKFQQSQE
ncbi:MAG: hypothetical protein QXK89_03905 [Candidatus Bathyarchaeia archaeon]